MKSVLLPSSPKDSASSEHTAHTVPLEHSETGQYLGDLEILTFTTPFLKTHPEGGTLHIQFYIGFQTQDTTSGLDAKGKPMAPGQ